MKLSTSGLKNIDFKQLAIAHGEKFAVVIVALLLAGALAKTHWRPFDKTPEDLVQAVEDSQSKILAGEWPEAEKFEPQVNLNEQLQRLNSPISSGRYALTTPFLWSLYRKKEPIREPAWYPVEDLVVDYGQVLLPLKSERGASPAEQLAAADTKAGDDAAMDEEDIPEEFRQRKSGGATGRRRPGAAAASGLRLFGGSSKNENVTTQEQIDALERERRNRRRTNKREDDGPGGAGYGWSGRGRGYRFVSVRGIFPLNRQLQEIAKAMHLDNVNFGDLARAIRFQNFELERQTMVRGAADPWSGPWEPVDVKVAQSVLEESEGWDDDAVADGVISNVFTMPLPYRAVGQWGSVASHPRIKDFELSEEQIQRQVQINQKLLEKLQAEKAKEPPKIAEGGFANVQESVRERMVQLDRATTGIDLEKLADELDPEKKDQELREMIKKNANPVGNLLLFRFLDFDVQPGNTYRYRVRLTLYNPFEGRKPEEVLTPEVAEGPLRKTDWSDPTVPIAVPDDANYFVAKVETGQRGMLPSAEIDLYQWAPDTGTVVNGVVKTLIGQYFGGTVRTHVVRPINGTYEREQFRFNTDDVLVDVAARPTLDKTLHSDLDFPSNFKGVTGVADRVLVMNKFGELVCVDPVAREDEHQNVKRRLEFQNREWEQYKDQQAQAQFDSESRLGKSKDKDEEKASRGGSKSSRDNPRRKSKKK